MQYWHRQVDASIMEFVLDLGPMDGKRVRLTPNAKKIKVGIYLYHRTSDDTMTLQQAILIFGIAASLLPVLALLMRGGSRQILIATALCAVTGSVSMKNAAISDPPQTRCNRGLPSSHGA